jgi:hypothetical protein
VMKPSVNESDLNKEVDEFREAYPKLEDDQLFVLWYLRAAISDSPHRSLEALIGGPDDKGVDAILIDEDLKAIYVVQGKYRTKIGKKGEGRNDVTSFANLAQIISGSSEEFRSYTDGMAANVLSRMETARKRFLKNGYKLRLHYATLGSCSKKLEQEAIRSVRRLDGDITLEVLDGNRVLHLLSDYLDGVAPPIPELQLEMESGDGIDLRSVFHRFDMHTGIDSWVFSMKGDKVAELFESSGIRLFARNIRGYLGKTEINRSMEHTIASLPEFFWYYNNGLTIVCDAAENVNRGGRSVLKVANPQIINGQQTTRTLARMGIRSAKASVTVRVIQVPRGSGDGKGLFDTLVTDIVAATNWQNAIRQSDLMANDRRQIEIERRLRPLGYWYIRKRESLQQAKGAGAGQHYWMIRKEELAQSVAACDLDPVVVRRGKENLFDEELYGKVFPNADPYYYLCRYWLMRVVSASAKGYPERAYAKWVVLNFLWSRMSRALNQRSKKIKLGEMWERKEQGLLSLSKACDSCYKAALIFYRLRRGKGARATDVSNFFKQVRLHISFKTFWSGSKNPQRTSFTKAWRRFERELAQ